VKTLSSRSGVQVRRQDFAEGSKNQRGQNFFLDTIMGVCSIPRAKHEMGGQGTTGPPLATALAG